MPDSRSLNPKTSSRPVVVAPSVGPRHQRSPRPVTASTTCVVTAGSGGSKSGISAPEIPSTALPTRSWHRTVTKYCRPCCIGGLGTQTCAVDRFASAVAGPNWSSLPGSVPICQVQFKGWSDHGAASAHAQRAFLLGWRPEKRNTGAERRRGAVGTLWAQWQHEFLLVVALSWRGVINVDHGHPGTIFALARAIGQGALGLGVEGTAPFCHNRVRLAVRRGGTSHPRRELLGEAEFHGADVGRRRVEEETIPTGSTARATLAGQLTQLPREAIEVTPLFRIEQPRLGFVRAGLGLAGKAIPWIERGQYSTRNRARGRASASPLDPTPTPTNASRVCGVRGALSWRPGQPLSSALALLALARRACHSSAGTTATA
eukprot:scaffold10720_cov69-Phaeocystis_antarctica.AAC.8